MRACARLTTSPAQAQTGNVQCAKHFPANTAEVTMEFTRPIGGILAQPMPATPAESEAQEANMEMTACHGGILSSAAAMAAAQEVDVSRRVSTGSAAAG